MKPERLDKLFDEALERTRGGKGAPDAYGAGPLAGDHLLLKKSWDYFKKRVQSIDQHYQELLKSKESENQALKDALAHLKSYIAELEGKTNEFDQWQHEVAHLRMNDLEGFQKNQAKLTHSWQEERISLEEKLNRLEFKLKESLENQTKYREDIQVREKQWIDRLAGMRTRLDEQTHGFLEKEKEYLENVRSLEQEIVGRDNKIDLMRSEIEQRDLSIHKLSEEKIDLNRKNHHLDGEMLDRKRDIMNLKKDIEHLQKTIDILKKEKEFIQKSWHQEQAEWRELWDRERENWENQKEQIRELKDKRDENSG